MSAIIGKAEFAWYLEIQTRRWVLLPSIWRYKEERGRCFLALQDTGRKRDDPSWYLEILEGKEAIPSSI